MIFKIRSLLKTPFGKDPDSSKRIVFGTLSQISPVAHIAATSVRPIPELKHPNAPYMQVWLSEPRTSPPGTANPSSGRT